MKKQDIEKIRKEIEKTSKSSFKQALNTVFAKKNMWYLAIGVLIGSAISAVINSLANDIIMSSIAHAFGMDTLDELSAHGIQYGKFVGALLSLLILGSLMLILVFILIFTYNSIKKRYKTNDVEKVKVAKAPSTEELILEQLQEINQKLSKKKKK